MSTERKTEPLLSASDPPRFRPRERFWPYVELPEQLSDFVSQELFQCGLTLGLCSFRETGYPLRKLSLWSRSLTAVVRQLHGRGDRKSVS